MLEEKRIIDFFLHVEENYPVRNWRMNGVDMWPLIRIFTGFKWMSNRAAQAAVQPDTNDRTSTDRQLSSLCRAEAQRDAVFLFDAAGRTSWNGKGYHRLVDPLRDELRSMGFSSVGLEIGGYHDIDCENLWNDAYLIDNQLSQLRSGIQLPESQGRLNEFDEVYRQFATELGERAAPPSYQQIVKWSAYINDAAHLFETLFLKLQAKTALMVNFYNLNMFAFSLGSRRAGIPSVDIQHGTQASFIYNQWSNVPQGGYNILPRTFWCWNDRATERIEHWAKLQEYHRAVQGGNPWIDLWKNFEDMDAENHSAVASPDPCRDYVHLLFTTQPLYGLAGWEHNIPDWVLQAIERSPEHWRWHVRYHPQMAAGFKNEALNCDKRLKKFVESGKVETNRATAEPLPRLLRTMDVHLTAFSSVIMEARELSVPSILLQKEHLSYYEHDHRTGWLSSAGTAEELLTAVLIQLDFKKQQISWNAADDEERRSRTALQTILADGAKLTQRLKRKEASQIIIDQVLLADSQYKELIQVYESSPDPAIADIAGYAYDQIGQSQDALTCYADKMQALINGGSWANGCIERLVSKLQLLKDSEFKPIAAHFLDNWLVEKANRGELSKGMLYAHFYKMGFLEQLMSWKGKMVPTADTFFYTGRALLGLNREEEAISELHRYLVELEAGQKDLVTSEPKFIASGHFYLGELYFKRDPSKAYDHFKSCLNIYQGNHEKASSYLRQLQNDEVLSIGKGGNVQ